MNSTNITVTAGSFADLQPLSPKCPMRFVESFLVSIDELASPNRFFRSLVPLRSMLNLTTDMFASQFYSLAITYPQMCCSLDGNSQESARNSCAPPIPWLQICTTSRQHWKHQQLLLCSSRNLEHNWHGFQRLTFLLCSKLVARKKYEKMMLMSLHPSLAPPQTGPQGPQSATPATSSVWPAVAVFVHHIFGKPVFKHW